MCTCFDEGMRTVSVRVGLVVVLAVSLAGIGGPGTARAAAASCAVVVPASGTTVRGTGVILSAAAQNATRVDYFLDGAYLGESRPTGFGWLFTPDGGRTWGWDSTTVADRTYALTCRAVSATGETGTSAPVAITVDNPPGCRVVVPTGSQPAAGPAVVFSAASDVPNTETVEYYLHSAATAVIPLGRAVLTGFGWLYTPDGGRTFGWDSTRVPDGVYGLTCTATAGGVRHTSGTRVFTVDNHTRHDWPSYCADHVAVTPADYQAAFDHRRDGWAGADGAHPIPLPDGRVMWLFGDTLAGSIDATNALQPGWRMPSNSVLIQSGTCFTPLMGGTPLAPSSFLTDAAGRRYWPASGYADTSVTPPVLRLTATQVNSGECGWFRLAAVRVFTLSLPDLRVIADAPAPYNQGAVNVPSFGTWLVPDGNQVYLYGEAGGFQCAYDENGPYPRGTYVARTTRSALATGPWQFWTGSGWSPQITAAAPMVFQGATADSIWYQNTVRYGNRFLTATRARPFGAFGPEVHAWFADSPAGPWTQLRSGGQPVNIIPSTVSFPQPRWHYGGMVLTSGVPGATATQPLLVFSTNGLGCDPANGTPCTRDNDVTLNVMLYGPHVVRPSGLPPAQ